MPRLRKLSIKGVFGQKPASTDSPLDTDQQPSSPSPLNEKETPNKRNPLNIDTITPQDARQKLDAFGQGSPRSPSTPSRARGDSRAVRPNSMIQTYQPPQVDVSNDTPPELQPIFSFLNSHSNKLYQEGYFLKLHDLDSRGRPSQSRVWNECFAQLVGTVLSLWDASALDLAGEDGEVVPTFINLSDASIKMIESLPMNGAQGGSLQNVLSISTAANNRYLLHFNSLNSLTQWTAGIRLAMFEHSTLQEAYTGSLIAGKGRFLNNIKQIMERSRFVHDDWARVRFGAGTPWKRCWCIISPPEEKEYAKAQKLAKKGSAYGRMQMPKGDIKFYDTRKVTKKTRPIATITDAYAAYAIYPQSKPLVDQSTLVKLEGLVTIHSSPETTTEGFVFVMPEVHAAVSGFEMMLRWLFPVFDTFALYGRPNRLIADSMDQRGLMFAMPRDRRDGYLDTLDVSGLIHTSGSQHWSERQWRKEMKKLTSTRMTTQGDDGYISSRQSSQRRNTTSRTSLPGTRAGVKFDDLESTQSSPGSRSGSPVQTPGSVTFVPPRRTDSAPPRAEQMTPHKRSASDAHGYRKYMTETPSRLSQDATRTDDYDVPPTPPRHAGALASALGETNRAGSHGRYNSVDDLPQIAAYEHRASQAVPAPLPEPVVTPPAFTHQPNSRPTTKLFPAPELRRQHSNVDEETLAEMKEALRSDRAADTENGEELRPPQPTYGSGYLPYRSHDMPALSDLSNSQPRDTRQRLSTIPGSPFVGEDAEYFQSPKQSMLPHLEGVAENPSPGANSMNGSSQDRPPMVPLHSSQSITRKPLPKALPQVPLQDEQDTSGGAPLSQVRSESPTSPLGIPEGTLIDEAALEQILNYEPDRANTLTSVASSVPDYASTASVSSRGPKKSIEKPRAGKLKTVGDPDMPTSDSRNGGAGRLDTYSKDIDQQGAAIPHVDFGPTYSYKPTHMSRPDSSGVLSSGDADHRRSQSIDKLRNRSTDRLSSYNELSNTSPREVNRNSYFGGRSTPTGEFEPSKRNSVAWSPAAASPSHRLSESTSLTPEQWVQHRAMLAAQPQVVPRKPSPASAHQHTKSSLSLQQSRQSMTKTPPPFARTPSGDWSQIQSRESRTRTPPPFARTPSGDWSQAQVRTPPNRPHSRGASTYFNQSPGGSSPNLSAREQMHVARATGTPLLNLASDTKAQAQPQESQGLIAMVAAREREKAAAKHGIQSGMVQQAIAARQQQQIQAEAEAQAQYQYQMQQAAAQQQAQAEQFQQMAFQQAVASPNHMAYNNFTVQQPRSPKPAASNWRSQFGPGLQQQRPAQQQGYFAVAASSPGTPQQYSPQTYGGGNTHVQQQQHQQQGTMTGHQIPQHYRYSGNYDYTQQQGGAQQPRR